jgi:glycosyltransferase involved in cell wall biosynthesis
MKQGTPRIFVFTYLPSPYQVELFDAVAASGVDLFVLYACQNHATPIAQNWTVPPIAHEHAFADAPGFQLRQMFAPLERSDLYVMNNYRHPVASPMLRERLRSGKAWCFWGERPGAHHPGLLARLYRIMNLWALRRSRAAIWGIGSWAVEAWRRDFGNQRVYCNVPYFSDLSRFAATREVAAPGPPRILFSGSLIERKGVDLLAEAFAVLAHENPGVHLTLAGVGPMKEELEIILSGCRSEVDFLGFVPWMDLPSVYAKADLLCVPSRYDGWAMVVPEGLAAGLPVLTTDQTGAAHDLIESGVDGWVIPANDGEALLKSLRSAAALSGSQHAAMSRAAAARAAKHQLSDGVARFIQAAEASLSA